MSKPIVLLVHGMGTHRANSDTITDSNKETPNITEEFVAGLADAAKRFNIKDYDISKNVSIHEFNYSHRLEEIRQDITDSLKDLSEENATKKIKTLLKSGAKGLGLAKDIIDFHGKLGEDSFLTTHWLDVLIYGSTFWGEEIRVRLVEKINELFRDTFPRDIHIIGHSLGTSVVHDTLFKLYNNKFKEKDKGKHRDIQLNAMRVKSLWSFANVSQLITSILGGIGNPNDDVVQSGIDGCCGYMYNVHNKFDPFTWVKPYKPKTQGAFIDIEVEDLRIANTHDLKEYVASPEVARMIMLEIDPLIGKINQKALESARKKYEKTTLNGKVDNLKTKLNAFKKSKNVKSLLATFTAWKELKIKLKELGENT
jgi:hypothetical protein